MCRGEPRAGALGAGFCHLSARVRPTWALWRSVRADMVAPASLPPSPAGSCAALQTRCVYREFATGGPAHPCRCPHQLKPQGTTTRARAQSGTVALWAPQARSRTGESREQRAALLFAAWIAIRWPAIVSTFRVLWSVVVPNRENLIAEQQADPEGKDCQTLDDAQAEIKRLRAMMRAVDPALVPSADDAAVEVAVATGAVVSAEDQETHAVTQAIKDHLYQHFHSTRDAFLAMDTDKSGTISFDEFKQVKHISYQNSTAIATVSCPAATGSCPALAGCPAALLPSTVHVPTVAATIARRCHHCPSLPPPLPRCVGGGRRC